MKIYDSLTKQLVSKTAIEAFLVTHGVWEGFTEELRFGVWHDLTIEETEEGFEVQVSCDEHKLTAIVPSLDEAYLALEELSSTLTRIGAKASVNYAY